MRYGPKDWFAKRLSLKAVDGDEAARRSQVVRQTIEVLGKRDLAISFLNEPNIALGGHRPIDIASSSDLGLRTVITLLNSMCC